MKMESLQDLYEHALKDLHSAERQILEALPKMIAATTDERLRDALQNHLEVTEQQLERLDRIFGRLGKQGQGKRCKGMEGILEEGKDLLSKKSETPGEVLDAGILAGAQHVEHYEIAGYGTALAYAELLEREDDVEMLQLSLDEEKEADRELSELAESSINVEAEVGAGA